MRNTENVGAYIFWLLFDLLLTLYIDDIIIILFLTLHYLTPPWPIRVIYIPLHWFLLERFPHYPFDAGPLTLSRYVCFTIPLWKGPFSLFTYSWRSTFLHTTQLPVVTSVFGHSLPCLLCSDFSFRPRLQRRVSGLYRSGYK